MYVILAWTKDVPPGILTDWIDRLDTRSATLADDTAKLWLRLGFRIERLQLKDDSHDDRTLPGSP